MYPSSTIKILPDQDDDDVSTLSGCSAAHPPLSSPKRPFRSTTLKSKTSKYLNGNLPVHVSKILNNKKKSHGGFAKRRTRIPNAIKINLDETEHSSSTRTGSICETSDKPFPVKLELSKSDQSPSAQPDSSNSSSTASASEVIDLALRSSLSPLGSASESTPMDGRRNHRRRSPAVNTARRQRLLRLRKQTSVIEAKDVPAPLEANISTPSTTKSSEVEVEESTIEGPVPVDVTTFEKDKGSDSQSRKEKMMPSSENEIRRFPTPPPPPSSPPPRKKNYIHSPSPPMHENSVGLDLTSVLTISPTTRSQLKRETPVIATPAKSSVAQRLETPKKDENNSVGRIHRSFWSVPATPNYSLTSFTGKQIYRSGSGSVDGSATSSSHSATAMSHHGSCKTEGSRLSKIVKIFETPPSRSSVMSRPSPELFGPIQKPIASPLQSSFLFQSPKPTHSEIDMCAPVPDNSPSKGSKSSRDSVKSFDDFYNDVMDRLKANKINCASKCSNTIEEPPVLNRLLLSNDTCIGPRCDGGSDMYSDSGSDIGIDSSGSDDEYRPQGGHIDVSSTHSDDESNAMNSLSPDQNFQIAYDELFYDTSDDAITHHNTYASSQEDKSSSAGSNYSASISIDISGRSKHLVNKILANLQSDLTQMGVEGEVNINIASSPSKCDNSVKTDQTPNTRTSTSDEENTTPKSDNSWVPTEGGKRLISTSNISFESEAFSSGDKYRTMADDEDCPLPHRYSRRNKLRSPTSNIVNKLRKATGRVLRRASDRKQLHFQHFDDGEQLLDEKEDSAMDREDWFPASVFPYDDAVPIGKN